ncbi:cutinase [Clohesyomyces aquaticus]|uniref:Cutinase n=1 Tax=Clohesyomyces aquaticus TaxID=1231657 RepID=A0A1Y1YCZ1_9PLEO|nr:cutinase [Clohesyomyces aquaticus]
MHLSSFISILSFLAVSYAAPLNRRATSAICPSYTVINARGTGEAQGPSSGFRIMNSKVTSDLTVGKVYNVEYPASADQNIGPGVQDIIDYMNSTLSDFPRECFIIQGYSQGAAVVLNALPQLTGPSFAAVKGVVLVGNPNRRAGLACNVDNYGGTTTKNVHGLTDYVNKPVPANWVGKTLDICIYGDGVCDTTHGVGINAPHYKYPTDTPTQELGEAYIYKQLWGST